MRSLLLLMIAAIAAALSLPACRDEQKVDVARKLNPERMPTMRSENVASLISDSGVPQYKIVTPLWLVYDNVDTPFWHFPKGIYLRKYDPFLNVVASVAADSARYFKNQGLWRLDGHVELHQMPKRLFMTPQLFWNQRKQELYSDSFIHIETETHVLEGYGFVSDEHLVSYRIIKPTGIFPVDRQSLHGGGGSHAAVEAVEASAPPKMDGEVPDGR